jgi:hypothetical protein
MSENNFEKKIQQRLEGLRLEPSEPVWHKVEARIREDKRRRRWLLLLPFLLLTLGGGAYWLLNGNNKPVTVAENNIDKPAEKKDNNIKETESENTIITPSDSEPRLNTSAGNKNNINSGAGTSDKENKIPKSNPRLNKNVQPAEHGFASIPIPFSDAKKKNRSADDEKVKSTKEVLQKEVSAIVSDYTKNSNEVISDKRVIVNPTTGTPLINNVVPDSATGIKNPENKNVIIKNEQTPLAQPTAIEKRNRDKQSLLWGISVQAGVSNITEALLEGQFKSALADFQSSPNNAPGGSGQIPVTPAVIKSSFAFGLGGWIEKPVSKKTSLRAGLNYYNFGSRMNVGNEVNSTRSVYNGLSSVVVERYYLPGNSRTYYNKYHLLELPVAVYRRFNKSERLPFHGYLSVNPGRIIGSKVLLQDTTGVFFTDGSLLNKTTLSFSTGLSLTIFNKGKFPVRTGPVLQYQLNNLNRSAGSKQHISFLGLQADVILGKKSKPVQRSSSN